MTPTAQFLPAIGTRMSPSSRNGFRAPRRDKPPPAAHARRGSVTGEGRLPQGSAASRVPYPHPRNPRPSQRTEAALPPQREVARRGKPGHLASFGAKTSRPWGSARRGGRRLGTCGRALGASGIGTPWAGGAELSAASAAPCRSCLRGR